MSHDLLEEEETEKEEEDEDEEDEEGLFHLSRSAGYYESNCYKSISHTLSRVSTGLPQSNTMKYLS